MRAEHGSSGPRARCSRAALSLALALGIATQATGAGAQPRPAIQQGASPNREPPGAAAKAAGGDLRGRIGVPVAAGLLDSEDADARLRGIVRLGAIGTTEAIDTLVGALDQGSAILRDPRARLTGVRVLAPYAKRDQVRLLLARELTDASPEGSRTASPLAAITRDTAALALARVEDKKATIVLVTAILQGGPVGEAAARAFRAYPPVSLEPFLGARKALLPAVAALVGDLGDLRAEPRLRAMLKQPDGASKAAAAIALAKLGDEAAAPAVAAWIARDDPALSRGAAEVLATLGDPGARAAIEKLLASDALVADGIRLALLDPAPGLDGALAKARAALPTAARDLRAQAIAAMGRAAETPAHLEPLLGDPDPETATGAALAIARMPTPAARALLTSRLAAARGHEGPARRLVVRAGVVRALLLGEPPEGLVAELQAMLGGNDASDRAVGAFGLVALGERPAGDLIASKDDAIAIAATRGTLATGRDTDAAFALLRSSSPARVAAGGVALLGHPDGGGLSTSLLSALAEAGGPAAALAARSLGARDDEIVRTRIKRLLTGTDPVVRAHVALGLGYDPEADSVSLLTSAYPYEEDASVRRAVIRALSRRNEVQRRATLALAAELDPDDGVRALARSALAGRVLDPARGGAGAPGREVAWIIVARPTEPKAEPVTAHFVRADGVAVPLVADPDGVLLVPGLPLGQNALSMTAP